jgi:hypothetical protein
MPQANTGNGRGVSGATRPLVCEDCGSARVRGEVGWVRLWLDEKYQPPVMLIYCPHCARQFDAYPEDVSPIFD